MKKLNFLIPIAIVVLILSCAKDSQSDFSTLEWKEVPVNSLIPGDCGCNKTKIKELSDYRFTVYGSTDYLILQQDFINAIYFDTISKTCALIVKHGEMVGTGKICNYPEEINNWDLREGKSVEVIISGTEFESCIDITGPSIYTHSDIILRKFLKKSNP
jgi:hypothetical protein